MKYRILLLMAFLSLTAFAQNVIEYRGEKINALDKQGKPDGIWKVYVDGEDKVVVTRFNSGVIIDGPNYLKNGKLVGSVIKEGLLIYDDNGKKTRAVYNQNLKSMIDEKGNEVDKDRYNFLSWHLPAIYYEGTAALYEFIGANLNFNALNGQKGRVKIKFVIDTTGKTSEITVVDSSNHSLDEEVIRVVSILPRFQPAHQNGKFVKMFMELPVNVN